MPVRQINKSTMRGFEFTHNILLNLTMGFMEKYIEENTTIQQNILKISDPTFSCDNLLNELL